MNTKIEYMDGFTDHLVSFDAELVDGVQEISGKAFNPEAQNHNFTTTFQAQMDIQWFEELKEIITPLDEEYHSICTDLHSYTIIFKDKNGSISRRHFYGLGQLIYDEEPILIKHKESFQKLIDFCHNVKVEITSRMTN